MLGYGSSFCFFCGESEEGLDSLEHDIGLSESLIESDHAAEGCESATCDDVAPDEGADGEFSL